MKKQKRIISIVLLISFVVALVAGLSVGITYAVWKNTRKATDVTEVPGEPWNASFKYQIFAALGADGNPLLAPAAQTVENTASLAFVGYVGLVEQLQIAESVSLRGADGNLHVKKVTKVMVLPAGGGGAKLYQGSAAYTYTQDVGMRGNSVVTSLTVAANIVQIAPSAFSSMTNLKTLNILGTTSITVGDFAFANCNSGRRMTYVTSRSILGDNVKIFKGTAF